MNLRTAVLGALSLVLVSATQGFGQSATTDPVGYAALPLAANSDSLISIPFTRPAAFVGAISMISGSTITTAGTLGTVSQYKYIPTTPTLPSTQPNTYYAIIGPMVSTVTGTVTVANGSTAVTATAGLSSIQAGDELIVNGLAYNVASVTSDTALVLSRAYTGTSGAGQTATYDHSPKEGCYYTVSDNGTNTLTVNLNGDSLSAVAVGTTVSVIPYWTLITAFPAANAGASFIASTSAKARATQILLPDMSSPGVNLPAANIFYFYNGAWVSVDSSYTGVPNETVLPPTSYFTVRNTSTATTFTPSGGVVMNRVSIPLDTQTNQQQDNPVSVPRPTSVTLNDLGLITSGAFAVTSGKARADQLLVYDNTAIDTNKAASAVYFYDTAWRLVGGVAGQDYGPTPIPYGVGLTIRKTASATGATAFWQNTRNY